MTGILLWTCLYLLRCTKRVGDACSPNATRGIQRIWWRFSWFLLYLRLDMFPSSQILWCVAHEAQHNLVQKHCACIQEQNKGRKGKLQKSQTKPNQPLQISQFWNLANTSWRPYFHVGFSLQILPLQWLPGPTSSWASWYSLAYTVARVPCGKPQLQILKESGEPPSQMQSSFFPALEKVWGWYVHR